MNGRYPVWWTQSLKRRVLAAFPSSCTAFVQNFCLLGLGCWSLLDTAIQIWLLPRTVLTPAPHCLSSTQVSCPAPESAEVPLLAVIQLCLSTCQVWIAHWTWLSFHIAWVYRTNCQGNITHRPIQRKKSRWNDSFLGTAISGCLVAFSFDKLNKECLCRTGNLVSLHEWTSQLLISFVPETKIWLPWLLSACWSNIRNHIRNYIANHFLTGSRIAGKYIWLE